MVALPDTASSTIFVAIAPDTLIPSSESLFISLKRFSSPSLAGLLTTSSTPSRALNTAGYSSALTAEIPPWFCANPDFSRSHLI